MNWKLSDSNDKVEMKKIYHDTLNDLINFDDKVVVLDADLAHSSGTYDLFEKYPNRCINCGISEANMIAASGGLSIIGMKPYVHSFSPFVTRRVLDQLYASVIYSKGYIHIYGSDPGVYAQGNGGTHIAIEDFSVLRAIPQLTIFAPSDPVTFEWILNEYRDNPIPLYTRAPRGELPVIYEKNSLFCIGRGQWLIRGNDIAVIAIGDRVHKAIEAQKILLERGVNISVIDLMFVKPYDQNLIQDVISQHKVVITFENHNIYGGIGDIVASEIVKSESKPVLIKIGIEDLLGESGDLMYLEDKFQISSAYLIKTIENYLDK